MRPLIIQEPRERITASAGAGYSSQSGVTGFVELGHNNLFGNGQSISIRLERGGKRSNVELSFTEPWFRDTPMTLGADIFNTQRNLVPGLATTGVTITCVDVSDANVTVAAGASCPSRSYIKVTVTATFRLVSPLLPVPNPITLGSAAHVQVP